MKKGNKPQVCIKCKLNIKPKSDSFIEVKEFNNGTYYNSVFWHKDCWKEWFSTKNEQKRLIDKANSIFSKFGLVKEEGMTI